MYVYIYVYIYIYIFIYHIGVQTVDFRVSAADGFVSPHEGRSAVDLVCLHTHFSLP